jgi:hypothetical protein
MKFTQHFHLPKMKLHAKIQENFSRNVEIILFYWENTEEKQKKEKYSAA